LRAPPRKDTDTAMDEHGLLDFTNKGVLITGGSRGLGRAVAASLAAAGAKVALVARDGAALHEAVAAIRKHGGDAHAIVADVADKESTHAIAGQAAALVGPIEILLNNASSLGHVPLRALLDTDCEALEETLAVNLVGAFRLTKAVLGGMVLRRRGVVVNVTSDAAVASYPGWGAYGVAKAALEHLGRIWGAELAGSGVRLFSFDPGEMDTLMHAQAMPDADRATLADPQQVAARLVALIRAAGTIDLGARVSAAAEAVAA
jgi:NAD(P)-dependent dehydrogenase (short-subunit alcohol dehydrogenase family)